MYLKQIEVVGFRGIHRLSFQLRSNMVLIGENAWGKSSLLDLLSLIFNKEAEPYQFQADDFFYSMQEGEIKKVSSINLLFTFSESELGELQFPTQHFLHPIKVKHEDGFDRIYLRVFAEQTVSGEICTTYNFIDEQGNVIALEEAQQTKLVSRLIQRHTVYRFRDARLVKQPIELQPIHFSKNLTPEIIELFTAVMTLLRYYFILERNRQTAIGDTSLLWQQAKKLAEQLRVGDEKLRRYFFVYLVKHFLPDDKTLFSQVSNPILLFEDPESRLHPRLMAIMWDLLSYIPLQRLITTNSVELLSNVPLHSICRLVRGEDRIQSYQLDRHDLGKVDLRRLTFHIHYNRSLVLFSRAWIFVEGETEVWILNELAKVLDINLENEGIRIVEFAQCGIKPLIKYANLMGIAWHLLTDGDEAGRKYVAVATELLRENEHALDKITALPKRDIEHYFYDNGFEFVFKHLARLPEKHNYSKAQIIQRAIQNTSKPDLALAIVKAVKQSDNQLIPLLFRRLFSKMLLIAKEQGI
ncbi:ATP-dependent endonuclease [Gallibacterium salpingitidis]|uniref:ATP-dependent endonuclease n=1 Tax=Gallibacterium salpingitidis TaxID=505341 RepID=A0AB36E6A3_9PAST|nr:DUF2813 domain-containing protein [Gallibacterium salpingitidis]OBX07915.1 ATP-dependent endonuclease [Gallibacterium salpingitidis]OBX11492.1 ATP-dependent endonuclease [Gallibacterium salpingitidis]WKT00715.1 ATP-dependent endonuclease [Gallibacterium salpingitidis]